MPDAQSTLSRTCGPEDLDHVAQELSGRGWIVRFEPHAFAPGARAGHLVLTRPRSSAAELIVACPRRHEIHIWVRTDDDTWSLGTVSDVDEVSDLLRLHFRGPSSASGGGEAAVPLAAARPEVGSAGADRSRAAGRRSPTPSGIDGGRVPTPAPTRHRKARKAWSRLLCVWRVPRTGSEDREASLVGEIDFRA